MNRRFPRSPAQRDNPFLNEEGANPFAEEGPDLPLAANPYAAASADASQEKVQPYHPGDYQAMLPHRGPLLFGLGVTGLSLSLIAVAVAGIMALMRGEASGLAYGIPVDLLALSSALPAWFLARADLQAIRAGAMEKEGFAQVRRARQMGMVGSLIAALPIVLTIGVVLVDLLTRVF